MSLMGALKRVSRIAGRAVRIAYVCGALSIVVLGAHGLYVHFSFIEALEALFTGGERLADLFLAIGVPEPLDEAVTWMSIRGVESWFVPTCFVVGGVLLIIKRHSIWRLLR